MHQTQEIRKQIPGKKTTSYICMILSGKKVRKAYETIRINSSEILMTFYEWKFLMLIMKKGKM